jgi:hypothetical protein
MGTKAAICLGCITAQKYPVSGIRQVV